MIRQTTIEGIKFLKITLKSTSNSRDNVHFGKCIENECLNEEWYALALI